jgi:hypothetical protein
LRVKGKNAKLLVLAVASAPNAKATAGFRLIASPFVGVIPRARRQGRKR